MTLQSNRAAWLLGGNERCNAEPSKPVRPRRLLLLGPPGVGKGTQAALLSAAYGACHLSTGEVFRHALTDCPGEKHTPAMEAALDHMHRGELVPDRTVLDLIRERAGCLACRGGFLLDGFPRTVAQAEALDHLLYKKKVVLDAVINYDCPDKVLETRIAGRRTCPVCKVVYHLETKPPRQPGVCDHCGSPLVQRQDDLPEAAHVRLKVYQESTAPLITFYREKHQLISVTATGTPEEIFARTVAILNKKLGPPT
jgi:adenylate kinase